MIERMEWSMGLFASRNCYARAPTIYSTPYTLVHTPFQTRFIPYANRVS